MGILNVTPDSFAEASSRLDPGAAIERALRLEAEGADLIDVGGESTRPGGPPSGGGWGAARPTGGGWGGGVGGAGGVPGAARPRRGAAAVLPGRAAGGAAAGAGRGGDGRGGARGGEGHGAPGFNPPPV